MKITYLALISSAILIGCQPAADNSASEAFERNSKVVLAELAGWENENMDYDAIYADDVFFRPTSFNSPDSASLEQIKESNQQMFDMFDFELLGEPNLLPGVHAETKLVDGSVRYYGTWKVTLPATDSTEEKTAELKMYESFDFNEEGKIAYQQGFGDFGGLMHYLMDHSTAEVAEETMN